MRAVVISSSTRRALAAAAMLALAPVAARAQVLRWGELAARDVARLDRARTVVVIPGGILEEHGPHLPTASDGVRNARIAEEVARAVAARPGWTAVVLPMVPLGSGPFDQAAGRSGFPGSLAVRATTVRAVFGDLADALGAQGFRWVFVVNGHGDPNHNRALDQAGDHFHAAYGGTMVHLLGRAGCQPESIDDGGPPRALFDSAAARRDADSPHAGAVESARTWALWPERVDTAGLRAAPDVTAPQLPDWRRAAAKADWPGYVGAPRFATRALGEWEIAREVKGCTALALRLLDGLDEKQVPRYADRMLAITPVRAALDSLLAREAEQGRRQEAVSAKDAARP